MDAAGASPHDYPDDVELGLPLRPTFERWDGCRPVGYLLRPSGHDHYCAEGDHRWPCAARPCVKHEAIPCHHHEEEEPCATPSSPA